MSFIGIVVINFRNVPIGDIGNISNFGDAAGIGVFSLKGEGLLFMASLSAAVGTIFNKNSTKKYNPITLSGSQLTFGGLCLTIIGLLCGGLLNPTNIKALLVLLYLSMLSATAITLWTVLLKYNSASKVSVFKFLTPIFGVLLSGIFLGENIINPWVGFSLILTCIGIVIMQKN